MTYKLHMNGIITGSLNSFCLACDVFLKCQQEAADHIGTSKHKKKSGAVQYSDKFQDEHIKKFQAGYYCEFCNVLLPIVSKVNLHITEDEHKHNKGILLLKPLGGDVVAYNNILIEEKAWHGLIDGVCALCNVELEDETEHKTDTSHSLQLVLKPIQFGADNAIFRHLDDTAVQCLTCNKLLAPARMTKHFDDTEHQELYAKRHIESNGTYQRIDNKENYQEHEAEGNCRQIAPNMTSAIDPVGEKKKLKIYKNGNAKSPAEDKSIIFKSIARYQSKGINIYLETETALCKKCSNVVTFNFMAIENHIKYHSTAKAINSDLLYPSNLDRNLNPVDINDKTIQSSDDKQHTEIVNDIKKSLQDNFQNAVTEATSHRGNNDTDSSSSFIPSHENFEKANPITNKDYNQSFCHVCEINVPASFRQMKEHVEGEIHKRLIASTITQPKISSQSRGEQMRQTTKDFIATSYDVRGMSSFVTIINEKFCVRRNSVYLVSDNDANSLCFVCEKHLRPDSDIAHHVNTLQHFVKWQEVPVITSEEREFIREVRPGMFHCGYCNLVIAGWADFKYHFHSPGHLESRYVGESLLMQHLPGLQQHKMQKNLENMAMMSFFSMYN